MTEFSSGYAEHVKRKLAEEHELQPEQYEILGAAEGDSPFLTLSECRRVTESLLIPERVIKILMVLPRDRKAFEAWSAVAEEERVRLQKFFNDDYPRGDLNPRFAFPGLTPFPDELPKRKLLALPAREMLTAGFEAQDDPIELSYFVRPFIHLPSIADSALDTREVERHWANYLKERELQTKGRESLARKLVGTFRHEALLSQVARDRFFLTSEWKYLRLLQR